MKIGDKIKYLRIKRGFTQLELAEYIQVHPVTIRKYETNKMVPQVSQLVNICRALNLSPYALFTSEYQIFPQDKGDLYGFILHCVKHNYLTLFGTRNEDGMLDQNSVRIELNRHIADAFEIEPLRGKIVPFGESGSYPGYLQCTMHDVWLKFVNQIDLNRLLQWECVYHKYITERNQCYPFSDDRERWEKLLELQEDVEYIELEFYLSYDDPPYFP